MSTFYGPGTTSGGGPRFLAADRAARNLRYRLFRHFRADVSTSGTVPLTAAAAAALFALGETIYLPDGITELSQSTGLSWANAGQITWEDFNNFTWSDVA